MLRNLLGYALADALVGCASHRGELGPMRPTDDAEARDGLAGVAGGAADAPLVSATRGYDLEAMATWVRGVQELAARVKDQSLDQDTWTVSMEAMLAQLDVEELLRFIDFERFTVDLELSDNGASKKQIVFPDEAGLPTDFTFVRQVFALGEGRSIVPHGHNNMVSTFLVIGGEFHGRHYERLETDASHMLLTPSIDHTFGVGDISSLSDDKDNVHWYLARRSPSYLFNIHVRDVVPGSSLPTGRVYVDPDGEQLPDDRIRARLIDSAEAHALYG